MRRSAPTARTGSGSRIRSGDETLGVLVVQTYEPGQFYTDDDVRVLTFVGQHVGTALSSARASAEVHQRVAELAIVNEVGQALARQLDFPSIMEAVGRRAAEALGADGLSIAMLDPEIGKARFLYWLSGGVRQHDFEGIVLDDVLTARILKSGQPIRVGTAEEADAIGAPFKVDGTNSYLGVPIPAGDKAIGVIAIGTGDRHAYGEEHERLLSTLATNMGVALDNARLFEETKRLLEEADARAAELETVNRIGNALASQLDLDSLIELVGEQMRSVFRADIVYVALLDEATRMIEFPYYSEAGRREPQAAAPVWRRPHLAHPPVPRAAGAQLRRAVRTDRDARHRDAGQVLAGRPDPGRRRGDRCHQRPELHRGGPVRRRRRAPARDAGGERRRRHPECPARFAPSTSPRSSTDGSSRSCRWRSTPTCPDSTSTSVYASPGTEAMFGYPLEAWMSDGFFNSVIHPDDRERIVNAVDTNLEGTTQKSTYEYRVIHADGSTVWVRDDSWIVRDDDGTPLHIQGFMLDITEQTEAAAEIRRQKQYFEALVEISPVAIVTMDRDEIVSGWNPAATRLFGYQPDEAIGRHIDDLLFAPSERSEGAATTRTADETGPRPPHRPAAAQGRRERRRRDRPRPADHRRRAQRLLRDLPRHHRAGRRHGATRTRRTRRRARSWPR